MSVLNLDNIQVKNRLRALASTCAETETEFKVDFLFETVCLNFHETVQEATLKHELDIDRLTNVITAIETDNASERTHVFAQIQNLEKMIQRIAAMPTPNSQPTDGKRFIFKESQRNHEIDQT